MKSKTRFLVVLLVISGLFIFNTPIAKACGFAWWACDEVGDDCCDGCGCNEGLGCIGGECANCGDVGEGCCQWPFVCKSGFCHGGQGRCCVETFRSCNGDYVMQHYWGCSGENIEYCEYGCWNNECIDCRGNGEGCGGDGDCCSGFCHPYRGECQGSDPIICNPGQTVGCGLCGTDTCLWHGEGWTGCQNQGTCSPGSYRCSGDWSQRCDGSCTWQNDNFCNNDYWDCSGDTRRDRDEYCDSDGRCREWTRWSEDCNRYNYNDCSGDTARTHDYSCSGGNCNDNVASTDCNNNDGWYCSGTTAQNRNYYCSSGNCNNYNLNSQEECQNRESNYCSGNRYYRNEWTCSGGSGCTDAADSAIGTNSDGDAWDQQCGDSVCDNAPGVSDATRGAESGRCADGLDNDCDGNADCRDADCVDQIGPNGIECCQNAGSCNQDDCVAEACTGLNECSYPNRGAGDTTECGVCQSCNVAGGDCTAITAVDGKNCANTCTSCIAGTCTNRVNEDNTECLTCWHCTGSGGDCTAVTAETGKNCNADCNDCSGGNCVATTENNDGGCNDDCNRCNVGACVNRLLGDGTECIQSGDSGTSSYCNAAGGDCKFADEDAAVCLSASVPDRTVGEWVWAAGRPTRTRMTDAGKEYSTNDHVFRRLFDSNPGACPGTTCNNSNSNLGRNCQCYTRASSDTIVNRVQSLSKGEGSGNGCCGDDPNEWLKRDYFGGECVSSADTCVWSDGHAQPANSGNAQWWCNPGDWYECNNDNIGMHDPPAGMCCAGTFDNTAWIPAAEVLAENAYSCTDAKDNDCDGQIDCDDTDCAGSVGGYALNQNGMGIFAVFTNLKKGDETNQTTSTDVMGKYNFSQTKCGTWTITASHPDYWPVILSGLTVAPNQAVRQDINMLLGTSCESDCTYVSDDIVHAACSGHSGCTFYDAIAMNVCDNSKTGWLRDYNSSHYIVCASGAPQSKVEISASLSCSSGTIVKVTRIVVYNGRPVKLVVATCG